MSIQKGSIVLCRRNDHPVYDRWVVAEALTEPQVGHPPTWFDARPLGTQHVIGLRGDECEAIGAIDKLSNSIFWIKRRTGEMDNYRAIVWNERSGQWFEMEPKYNLPPRLWDSIERIWMSERIGGEIDLTKV
jgi:hypothetical protein